jgi:hypothetical protein
MHDHIGHDSTDIWNVMIVQYIKLSWTWQDKYYGNVRVVCRIGFKKPLNNDIFIAPSLSVL